MLNAETGGSKEAWTLDQAEPLPLAVLLGTGMAFALLILAYVSGFKVMRLRRLARLEYGPGRPMPPALQWHLVAGLFAGANVAVDAFAALSSPFGSAVHMASLVAALAVVFTGVSRAFFGGDSRWHLLAALAAAGVFAARLAGFVTAVKG